MMYCNVLFGHIMSFDVLSFLILRCVWRYHTAYKMLSAFAYNQFLLIALCKRYDVLRCSVVCYIIQSLFVLLCLFAVYLIPPIKCYQCVPIIKCLTSNMKLRCFVLFYGFVFYSLMFYGVL